MDSQESNYQDVLEMARALLSGNEDPADLWEANDLVSRALRMRPVDAEAWILKAQILSALDDDTAALAAAEMALRRAPKNTEVHYWRATILADLERYADALRSIDRAFRCLTDEDDWLVEDLYCEKAMVLEAAGRSDEALVTYRTGLSRCPESQLLAAAIEPVRRENLRATLKVLPGGLQ
jgi:tetratricopeptide (TPR) repeat protein